MKPTPLVSVIMGAYNAEGFLSETLESILHQNYPNLELIVIDDASTDGTWPLLQSFKNLRLRIYRNRTNRGIPATRNRGLRLAKGQYLTFFDHDDLMLPGAIRRRVGFLEKNKQAKAVFGFVDAIVGKNGYLLRTSPRAGVLGMHKRYMRFFRLFKVVDLEMARRFFLTPLISLSTLMVCKNVIQRVGGLRRDLKITDDIDFIFKLMKITPLYFQDIAIKNYRWHGMNTSSVRTNRKVFLQEISTIKKLHQAGKKSRQAVGGPPKERSIEEGR